VTTLKKPWSPQYWPQELRTILQASWRMSAGCADAAHVARSATVRAAPVLHICPIDLLGAPAHHCESISIGGSSRPPACTNKQPAKGIGPPTADLMVGRGVLVVLSKHPRLVPAAQRTSEQQAQHAHALLKELKLCAVALCMHGRAAHLSSARVALSVQVMGPLAWISAFMLSRPLSRPCCSTTRRW
jgi:hypothetical protein